MNAEQQAYQLMVQVSADETAERLSAQVAQAPTHNTAKATKAAIKLAFIEGAQWAMHDALQTVKSKKV